MKILWYEEFKETFEFVSCLPYLDFLPMEVMRVLVNYSYVTHKTLSILISQLLVQIFSLLNPSDLMVRSHASVERKLKLLILSLDSVWV